MILSQIFLGLPQDKLQEVCINFETKQSRRYIVKALTLAVSMPREERSCIFVANPHKVVTSIEKLRTVVCFTSVCCVQKQFVPEL